MKKRWLSILIILFLVLICFLFELPCSYGAERPLVRIGIVSDGPSSERFRVGRDILHKEILELTRREFDIRFPADKQLHGNWQLDGIRQAVDQLLADPDVGIIIALGFISSHEICQRKDLPKPVIAPFIFDREFQGLPFKSGASGVKNLSYIIYFGRFDRDLKAFREIVDFSRLAVIFDHLLFEIFPQAKDTLIKKGQEYGIEIMPVSATSSAESTLEKIPSDTEVVFISPLPRFSSLEFNRLIAGINSKRLPSFSGFGRAEVEDGVMAGVAPKFDVNRLTRRVALYVQRILLGEDASTLPVTFRRDEQLTINMATARAISFSPPWKALIQAELLNEERKDISRKLSLSSAVRDAIKANLDIAAGDRGIAAGKQKIKRALSILLPQIDLFSEFKNVDKDQATVSSGLLAERTFSGSVTLSQLIYSEQDKARYDVEKLNQISREESQEQLKLDIALLSSVAYLNVLRSKTLDRIQKDNLKVTRSNLELAKTREIIGFSGREEVFRWESELATNLQRVIDTAARIRTAENTLNRILNRPVEEPFLTEETDLDNPLLLVSDKRIFNYIDNPMRFSIFRNFMVEEGLDASPELRGLDADIKAQKRTKLAAKRAFWSPELRLEGNVGQIFDEGGTGSDEIRPEREDTEWSVGVKLSFPLITGGNKMATLRRANEELLQLYTEKKSTTEKIEESIRTTLYFTSASYRRIQLSKDAAEAARKNLELVTDQYSRGTRSIIDLLDAQNASLDADERAENAVYNFLIDLMNAQRAVAKIDFFVSDSERKAWFERLEKFYKQRGMTPGRR